MMAPNQQALYEEISVIGTGAYGTVYKGFDLKTSRIVAMKRIRIQITDEGLPISTVREIAYLRQLEKFDHENIVRLLDVINGPRLASEQSVILIFEYIDYDLNTYLKSHTCAGVSLGVPRIVDLMRQLLTGVDFLHSNRIVHRDLKPQNLLITKEGRLKIADFGLARIYSFAKVLTSVVVTLWYRSPEVLLHSAYTSTVDMWSCGCIFAELYMRRPLFIGQTDIDQLYKIFEIMGLPEEEAKWPSDAAIPLKSFANSSKLVGKAKLGLDAVLTMIDPDGLELLHRLLEFDLNARISAHDALKHPYFERALQNAASAAASSSHQDEQNNKQQQLPLLPDITNIFQQNQQHQQAAHVAPNILKRKRILNQAQTQNK